MKSHIDQHLRGSSCDVFEVKRVWKHQEEATRAQRTRLQSGNCWSSPLGQRFVKRHAGKWCMHPEREVKLKRATTRKWTGIGVSLLEKFRDLQPLVRGLLVPRPVNATLQPLMKKILETIEYRRRYIESVKRGTVRARLPFSSLAALSLRQAAPPFSLPSNSKCPR